MSHFTDIQKEGVACTVARIKKRNPEYARAFSLPEKLESYEDLAKLPFLTKDLLRLGYPFGYICADKKEICRTHMSSGTTGTPIINCMTRSDLDNWGDIMSRCMKTVGMTAEDVIQVTPSFGLFNGGFGFHYGAEKLGAFLVPIGAGRSTQQLKLMKDLGTTVLAAIASYPLRLMEIAKAHNFDFKATNLKTGIFGAEVWSEAMRDRIEKAFGIRAYDIIGMTETGGVGMGIDCSARSGLHIWDDCYIAEIIDPKTLEQLPDGEEGELVITTTRREGLPLIRYRTSDITKIVGRDKCACGLETVRIAKLKGRTDDMLKVKGINFYPSQVESILFQFKDISDNYVIVLEESAGKSSITLTAESDSTDKATLKERVSSAIYDTLAFHAEVKFVPTGTLERKEGKAVRVIDKRN